MRVGDCVQYISGGTATGRVVKVAEDLITVAWDSNGRTTQVSREKLTNAMTSLSFCGLLVQRESQCYLMVGLGRPQTDADATKIPFVNTLGENDEESTEGE